MFNPAAMHVINLSWPIIIIVPFLLFAVSLVCTCDFSPCISCRGPH